MLLTQAKLPLLPGTYVASLPSLLRSAKAVCARRLGWWPSLKQVGRQGLLPAHLGQPASAGGPRQHPMLPAEPFMAGTVPGSPCSCTHCAKQAAGGLCCVSEASVRMQVLEGILDDDDDMDDMYLARRAQQAAASTPFDQVSSRHHTTPNQQQAAPGTHVAEPGQQLLGFLAEQPLVANCSLASCTQRPTAGHLQARL